MYFHLKTLLQLCCMWQRVGLDWKLEEKISSATQLLRHSTQENKLTIYWYIYSYLHLFYRQLLKTGFYVNKETRASSMIKNPFVGSFCTDILKMLWSWPLTYLSETQTEPMEFKPQMIAIAMTLFHTDILKSLWPLT